MANLLRDEPEIEYIAGQPYPKVSPKRIHAVVQLAIAMILQRCAAERGIAGTEWRFKLGPGTELVPDVAYISYDRLRPLTDEQAEEPPFSPDVAVEVRSPSHRRALSEEKVRLYLAHGATLVLDVDPYARILFAHTSGGVEAFHSGERFACEAISWLIFDIADMFVRVDIPR